MPRRSRTKETSRWTTSPREANDLMTRYSTTGGAVGFIAERRRSDQQPLVARHVAAHLVKVQQRDIDRPLVEKAHQHDGARTARVVAEIVDEVAASIERLRHGYGGECREGLHFDGDAVGAIEQPIDLGAHRILEGVLIEALLLRLPGHDQPPRIGNGRFQCLAGEEDDRGFQDRKDHRQKRRPDHAEFDRRNAGLLTRKTARETHGPDSPYARCKFGPHIPNPGYDIPDAWRSLHRSSSNTEKLFVNCCGHRRHNKRAIKNCLTKEGGPDSHVPPVAERANAIYFRTSGALYPAPSRRDWTFAQGWCRGTFQGRAAAYHRPA